MNAPNLSKITIVGGGTAGWMAAVAINQACKRAHTKVEVIESEEIGTVGVGEATIPTIRLFNNDIHIDEVEMIKKTNGSFKLGIQFCDWQKKGTNFFHGFGDYGINEGPNSTLNMWTRFHKDPEVGSFDDQSMAAVMATLNRFAGPTNDKRSPLSLYNYAFHFDAALYAGLLRDKAIAEGVTRTEGRIVDVKLRANDGFIEKLVLSDGREIEGDMFVDCSGFIGLLTDKALKNPMVDYSHILPVNGAWAVPCESIEPLTPYTRATALEAGWQWRIPLQSRIGNGYVFASDFMSEQEALDRLMNNLDGKPLAEPRLIRFKTGRREKFWVKNCVAIGLSSGFVEPLESTAISLIQGAITRLITRLPRMDFNPHLAVEFNRVQALEYDRIRDFIIMHYCLSERNDSEFWRYMKNIDIPETLKYKIDTFREVGVVPLLDLESFVGPSWMALFVGMGLIPQRVDPLLDGFDQAELKAKVILRAKALKETALKLPSHQQFIDQYCKSPLVTA